jgi:predicted transposase YbfD/YdcC
VSLISAVRRQVSEGAGVPAPGREPPEPPQAPEEAAAPLLAVLAGLTDRRSRRGVRHSLASVLSVLVVAVACGAAGPLAVAQFAAGFSQELLAALGCRRDRRTGLLKAPSASTFDRVRHCVDVTELEAALSSWAAARALTPRPAPAPEPAPVAVPEPPVAVPEPPVVAAPARPKRPSAADELREVRADGWVRAAPEHPFVDPQVLGDPGHRPARAGLGVDGKERRGARKGGRRKVHLLAALVHHTGLVVGREAVARSRKANEVSHFQPLLAPLPLAGVVVTGDAMQTTHDNARFLREDKHAHYLLPILGNQPTPNTALNALDWEDTPVAAATVEINRGRVETRTLRVLPAPPGTDLAGAARAVLVERYVTQKKNGAWVTRTAEAVLYLTSLAPRDTTPADLLAHIRGHWGIEALHWLRDVNWREDHSLLRTGDGPEIMSALTNLVISLFRLQGVTKYRKEIRQTTQEPHRVLHLLAH